MAQRHWLDPLARQVLMATGQLPARQRARDQDQGDDGPLGRDNGDRDPLHQNQFHEDPLQQNQLEIDQVERELLALKLRQNPAYALRDGREVRLAASLGWQLDVNRATRADWQRLPGITAAQVDLLQRLQAGGVQLSGPDDLQRLLELEPARLATWLPVLAFRWYGEPPPLAQPGPLDLNGAPAAELRRLGLSGERLQRLLRERSRGPFRDLADLQARLQLPPALVEQWIGRVCFGGRGPGPSLPLAPGPRRQR